MFYFIRKSHLSICVLLTGLVLDRTRATRDLDVADVNHIKWFSHVQVRIFQLTFSEVYVGWFYALINGHSIFSIFIDGDWRNASRASTKPRYNRSNRHGTRDWRIFITLSRGTGLAKDVCRGRWSRFQVVAVRRLRRAGGKEEVTAGSYD